MERVANFLGSGEHYESKDYGEIEPPDPESIFGPLKTPKNDLKYKVNVPRIARTIINHGSLTPSNHASAITNKINQQNKGFGL